ncbi:uncharacterized protein SPPG_07277 [Spizellomyces punctatus DAOM BR117]|uniref:Uncharacterized protein n=1 Tax=Spizellomyces punctatus (strain DAOM BR117) TaxID=645134 RepID=A0A0L0H8T3_SPIPD|nr:uncharacterized protein SPPG_07277 [Spizellomyces punctatus DAOM BR117]KNC97349.1 hypothetical protein SPPG_07277 [Spizellomyces punctatus DAOM BR117]|eukprot:XP_016605389.1 hypothetical protein SPPG_07277 [Spizellomyces punctatus DAOM BR117]
MSRARSATPTSPVGPRNGDAARLSQLSVATSGSTSSLFSSSDDEGGLATRMIRIAGAVCSRVDGQGNQRGQAVEGECKLLTVGMPGFEMLYLNIDASISHPLLPSAKVYKDGPNAFVFPLEDGLGYHVQFPSASKREIERFERYLRRRNIRVSSRRRPTPRKQSSTHPSSTTDLSSSATASVSPERQSQQRRNARKERRRKDLTRELSHEPPQRRSPEVPQDLIPEVQQPAASERLSEVKARLSPNRLEGRVQEVKTRQQRELSQERPKEQLTKDISKIVPPRKESVKLGGSGTFSALELDFGNPQPASTSAASGKESQERVNHENSELGKSENLGYGREWNWPDHASASNKSSIRSKSKRQAKILDLNLESVHTLMEATEKETKSRRCAACPPDGGDKVKSPTRHVGHKLEQSAKSRGLSRRVSREPMIGSDASLEAKLPELDAQPVQQISQRPNENKETAEPRRSTDSVTDRIQALASELAGELQGVDGVLANKIPNSRIKSEVTTSVKTEQVTMTRPDAEDTPTQTAIAVAAEPSPAKTEATPSFESQLEKIAVSPAARDAIKSAGTSRASDPISPLVLDALAKVLQAGMHTSPVAEKESPFQSTEWASTTTAFAAEGDTSVSGPDVPPKDVEEVSLPNEQAPIPPPKNANSDSENSSDAELDIRGENGKVESMKVQWEDTIGRGDHLKASKRPVSVMLTKLASKKSLHLMKNRYEAIASGATPEEIPNPPDYTVVPEDDLLSVESPEEVTEAAQTVPEAIADTPAAPTNEKPRTGLLSYTFDLARSGTDFALSTSKAAVSLPVTATKAMVGFGVQTTKAAVALPVTATKAAFDIGMQTGKAAVALPGTVITMGVDTTKAVVAAGMDTTAAVAERGRAVVGSGIEVGRSVADRGKAAMSSGVEAARARLQKGVDNGMIVAGKGRAIVDSGTNTAMERGKAAVTYGLDTTKAMVDYGVGTTKAVVFNPVDTTKAVVGYGVETTKAATGKVVDFGANVIDMEVRAAKAVVGYGVDTTKAVVDYGVGTGKAVVGRTVDTTKAVVGFGASVVDMEVRAAKAVVGYGVDTGKAVVGKTVDTTRAVVDFGVGTGKAVMDRTVDTTKAVVGLGASVVDMEVRAAKAVVGYGVDTTRAVVDYGVGTGKAVVGKTYDTTKAVVDYGVGTTRAVVDYGVGTGKAVVGKTYDTTKAVVDYGVGTSKAVVDYGVGTSKALAARTMDTTRSALNTTSSLVRTSLDSTRAAVNYTVGTGESVLRRSIDSTRSVATHSRDTVAERLGAFRNRLSVAWWS